MRSGCRNTVVLTSWRMNTWLLRTWLLYLSATSVLGELTKQCTSESDATGLSRGVCGKQLADIMQMVCTMYGGYFSSSSVVFDKRPSLDQLEKRRKRDLNLPLLSKQDAKTMFEKRMGHGRAVKQGIVCECCRHQCGMREMREYCSIPDTGQSGYRRHGRASPRVMAKKWISAPGVKVNDGVTDDAGGNPEYLGTQDVRNDGNAMGILDFLNLFPSSADRYEYVVPAADENIATEYDLLKKALLSTPNDYMSDFNLENFINNKLDTATKRMYDTSDKDKHLNYVPNNVSDLKSNEINVTSDRNLNQIYTRNRNYENGKKYPANAEMSAGWLQTKLAHIDSLDKVTDWLRALGAPGFKLNEKHKVGNKIEDKGGQ